MSIQLVSPTRPWANSAYNIAIVTLDFYTTSLICTPKLVLGLTQGPDFFPFSFSSSLDDNIISIYLFARPLSTLH